MSGASGGGRGLNHLPLCLHCKEEEEKAGPASSQYSSPAAEVSPAISCPVITNMM